MKNVLHSVSFACAILTISCGQTVNGQVYGEYQIVDPSNTVYEYDQVQQAPVYSESVVYGGGVVYDESYVESPPAVVGQSIDQPEMIISKDFGYSGPGTMRDHLWRDHSDDLTAQGTSQDALMAMTDAQVQTLHNEFHAAETAEFLRKNPNAKVQQSTLMPNEQPIEEQLKTVQPETKKLNEKQNASQAGPEVRVE